jgi:hypothetical protein
MKNNAKIGVIEVLRAREVGDHWAHVEMIVRLAE